MQRLPDNIRAEIKRLKQEEKKKNQEIIQAIKDVFGVDVSDSTIYYICKPDRPKKKSGKKVKSIVNDNDPIDKIVKDIRELMAGTHQYYRNILLGIRRELIKSRHELRKISEDIDI